MEKFQDNTNVENNELPVNSLYDYEEKSKLILNNEQLSPDEKAASLYSLVESISGSSDDDIAALRYFNRHEVFPQILGPHKYREFGREILNSLKNDKADLRQFYNPELTPELSSLPDELRDEVIGRFVDKKLLKYSKDGQTIKLGKNKEAKRNLEMGNLDTAKYVRDIFAKEFVNIENIDDVKQLHAKHDEIRKVQQVRIKTDRPGARILPINEMRIGHQDSLAGIELVEAWIDKLNDTKDNDKPSAILVTNLVQGDFAHSQSKKRASLVTGLDSMQNQFKTAKIILDKLRETDIPVIHSLGADDHRIAHDYTIDVLAELRKLATGDDNFISYFNQNELLQSDTFQQHKKFQIQYMLPLCYHLGRRLRTADELSKETLGDITRSEYLMIYDHVVMGQPLHPGLNLDEASLKGLGEWYNNTVVVDDADIVIDTENESRTIRYRHTESFSPDTLAGNHTDTIAKMLGNLGTNGYNLPDVAMTGRAQEAVYLTASQVPVVALPGLTDPVKSLGSNQYHRLITGDPSLRANATRKRLWTPTIDDFEIADNGDIVHRYINKEFLDMADSLPRTAVFELCDIQKGSPTSRSDYFIKYLSYILETAEEMPVALQWAGDIIHGHIYSGFSDESQAVGLIKIRSQKLVIEEYLNKAFGDESIPPALLNAVIDVLIQQGNHDEIQRKNIPNNNDSNIDYLIHTSRKIFDRPNEPSRVRHVDTFHTKTGTPVPTWMGTTHLGAYTLRTAHYHLERGVKGNTSGLPLHHAYQRAQGLGVEEDANIFLGAHWHNEQSGMVGNKLMVVGGAWAERSQFEDVRGYDARMAGAVIYLGGGEPPEVRFVHAENLDARPIKYGFFTKKNLEEHGYRDDPDFDPTKHAQYSNDAWPKSALQKALKDIERRASQLVENEAEMVNPKTYDESGKPVSLNDATRRAFEVGRW